MTSTALALRALTKDYGQRRAVDHLDLEVASGEVFGFLGPNGAGKTTTIRMCLGLINPTAGRIEVLGMDVLSQRSRVLPRVGALVESPALHPYLSGRENLRVSGLALGGVSSSRLDQVLEMVGLSGRDRDRVSGYSLGMKQRLGLGVALLHDPDLLILDEPANGLDPAGIREMREMLLGLAAAGKTVFVSSHVLAEVQQTCSRVAIIHRGRLVREAAMSELVTEHGEFEVKVDNPDQVLALIQAQTWGREARLQDGLLITPAPSGRGRELIRFLVDSGVYPDQVAPRQRDLEDIFLTLTGGQE
ncbi:MAG TPA: ABC transporter ATP-binding protein [Candidatus Nitrosotalea sp.]|nr:ABC transporter ATP-binding protein [Candidatus Nitrosotalea sp.]